MLSENDSSSADRATAQNADGHGLKSHSRQQTLQGFSFSG